MGLFDKLFGNTDKKNEEPSQPQHTEDWDSYFSNVDNVIGSIMVDLELNKVGPILSKPNVVWVSVTMQNPREDGFSSNEEANLLFDIEDNLADNLAKKHQAIYAGRLTSNGKRTFYFYLGDTTLYDQTISETMVQYPSYEYDYGTKEDKLWDGYFDFLYPLPDQFQMIMNARVIRNLENSGDNLEAERMVDHWICFTNETDAKNYIAAIEKLNFKVLSENTRDDITSEFKYEINIGRVDKVDYDSVNEYVLNLWDLAQENNGLYDGWGCPIVKE